MNVVSKLVLACTVPLALLMAVGCTRTPQNYLSKADGLFRQGKFEEASIAYKRAIQMSPDLVPAYHHLGMSEYAQGRLESSLDALNHAAQLAPNDVGIMEDLADVRFNRYLVSGRPQVLYDSVTALVGDILKKKSDSAVALRLQASLQYGDGKIKDAIATFEKANQASPSDPAVVLPMVDALRIDGRNAEAEKLALQLSTEKPDFAPIHAWLAKFYLETDRPAEAEKIYKNLSANHPRDPSPLLSLAVFYRNEHKDKEAKEVMDGLESKARDFPNRYMLAGDFYQTGRNLAEAERCYRAGITADPAQGNVYLVKLAGMYLNAHRNEDARQVLDQAIHAHPDDWDAQSLRIAVLLATPKPENVDEGITAGKAMLKKDPSDSRFPELLGHAYELKGDRPTAESFYRQAAQLDEQFAEPRLALAEISKARRDVQAVFRYSEEVLRLNQRDQHARLLHAWALINQNDIINADREMQTLTDEFPDSYEVKLQTGLLDLAAKRTRAAIDLFRELLQSHPGDPRILAGLATAYLQGRSFDAAVDLVAHEVQKDPNADQARLMLARLYVRRGSFDLALQQYKVLLAAHANSPDFQFEIGTLYEYLGNKSAAVESYETACRLKPDNATFQGRLALAYFASGQMQQADAAYVHSLALSPADPVLMNNRAYFLAETGNNPDEALHLAQNALAKLPDNPGILDTLALSYLKKNMGDNALQILNRLITNFPDEPMFRYHLAMALIQKGDRDAARKQLQESLTKHPSGDDTVKIRSLLAQLG